MRKGIIKRRKYRNNLYKRYDVKNSFLKKTLFKFIISSSIVLSILCLKLDFVDGENYLNKVKYILEYNLDFKNDFAYIEKHILQSYKKIKKETMEVFKTYDGS